MPPTTNTREFSADVTIIGFGPTGATLAALLGDHGLAVTVIDRLDDLYPHPRAAGIDHEALRILQKAGVADAMRDNISPYRPSEYLGEAGQLIQRIDSAPPPHRLGWHPNYVFDQPMLERLLRAKVQSLPNVNVLLGTEVQKVDQDGSSCHIAALDNRTRQPIELTSRYVVACDGGASPTRTSLGIGLEDHGFHEPWLVVDVQVSDEAAARLPQTQVQYCDPRGPATYIVLLGNLRRWEIQLDDTDVPTGTEVMDEQVWTYLSRWVTPEEAEIRRAAAYTFHALTAKEWQQERVLLAGDAAHMTPPFMTQGMVQGLRDADNLAWKLARVVNGSPAALLETYEAERRPHVVQTTTRAIELGRVICERDPAAARKRDVDLLAAQGGRVVTRLRQDSIPSLVSGLLATDTPGAGEMLPQPRVMDVSGQEVLFDEVVGRSFFIVTTEQGMTERPSQPGAELDARTYVFGTKDQALHWLDERTAAVSEDAALIEQWLESKQARYALVRPDKYVYGTAADRQSFDRLLTEAAARLGAPSLQRHEAL